MLNVAHIKSGFVWSQLLDVTIKECTRSVTRGTGVARQSGELPLAEVAELDFRELPVSRDAPFDLPSTAVLSTLWVLREVEAAWAAAGDVVLDERAAKVHWKLPVSKTDPRAVSRMRSWGAPTR